LHHTKNTIIHQLTNLETERLHARLLTKADTDAWMEFLQGEGSRDYIGFIEPTREACEAWIDRQLQRYRDDGFGLMALILKNTGELVGQCGLIKQELEGETEIEIGYHILPRFRGKVYATEAAIAFRKYAFENNFAESIISIIHPDNKASQKVAKKNGMKPDFITEKCNLAMGIPHVVFRTERRG